MENKFFNNFMLGELSLFESLVLNSLLFECYITRIGGLLVAHEFLVINGHFILTM